MKKMKLYLMNNFRPVTFDTKQRRLSVEGDPVLICRQIDIRNMNGGLPNQN